VPADESDLPGAARAAAAAGGMTITFTVFGVAQPQGSARAFMPKGARFPVVTSDNPQLKQWRQLVAAEASRALNARPASERGLIVGPVRLIARFYLARPKSIGAKAVPHLTRPDLDKIVRAAGDALTGVLWRDDSQINECVSAKAYADVGQPPHVVITVKAS
jgi:crossover junction endodeoxyribonuclease RusA